MPHVVLHNYNIVSYVPTAVTRGKLAATHRQSRHGATSRVASELALNRAFRAFITMVSSLKPRQGICKGLPVNEGIQTLDGSV